MNRIARAVQDRRLEVGFASQTDAAHAAGIGTTTWHLMESPTRSALPKSRRVRQLVARTLRWPPDALDNLEAGRPPDVSQPVSRPEPVAFELAELRRAVEEQRALLERLIARQQELNGNDDRGRSQEGPRR